MASKLSQTEKYAIQGMLHTEMPIADIAKKLNRTITCIQKYIDGELDNIHTTITKAMIQAPTENIAPVEINTVEQKVVPATLGVPYGQAKRTFAHNREATVMTEAAAQVGDEVIKHIPKKFRSSEGNIYDTEGNQIA
jgi:hypothetical protein